MPSGIIVVLKLNKIYYIRIGKFMRIVATDGTKWDQQLHCLKVSNFILRSNSNNICLVFLLEIRANQVIVAQTIQANTTLQLELCCHVLNKQDITQAL